MIRITTTTTPFVSTISIFKRLPITATNWNINYNCFNCSNLFHNQRSTSTTLIISGSINSISNSSSSRAFHSTQRPSLSTYNTVTTTTPTDDTQQEIKIEWDKQSEFLSLQPEEIAKELDKYIVGQGEAKRAVAIAMRNRWRRNNVSEKLRKEIIPKNILMVGPTGCGKSEVARRMAKLADAPFIKVEATKFTEVGFRGADVDQIIKDLLEIAIRLVKERETNKLRNKLKVQVEDNILDLLFGNQIKNENILREQLRQKLRDGHFEESEVEYEPKITPKSQKMTISNASGGGPPQIKRGAMIDLQGIFNFLQQQGMPRSRKSKYCVKDVRPLEEEAQLQKILPEEVIVQRAIYETQEYGIVFIDELDKITSSGLRFHADASDEGVQRDLLPIIEGTKIATDHGEVDTSKILFITAGAFHQAKPSDLIAELQGRLPIRVQLHDLAEEDMYRILTEPESHTIKQQRALLRTEGVDLRFTDEALREIAKITFEVNQSIENIGARRLYTVIEKVLEEISFNATSYKDKIVVIDKDDVELHMKEFKKKADLKQYIL